MTFKAPPRLLVHAHNWEECEIVFMLMLGAFQAVDMCRKEGEGVRQSSLAVMSEQFWRK